MNRNITYIDDLPFLEDIEGEGRGVGMSMIPTSETNNIKRFIRNNNYNLPPEAGMNTKQQQMENEELLKQQQMYAEQQQLIQQQEQQQQIINSNNKKNKKKQNKNEIIENYHDDLNCICVANHTSNCVVCSRLYTNDNKNMYLGIIGVLIIICLILLKKIVENTK